MKIIAAAIKFYMENDPYPSIMTAKRHCNILEKMYDLHIKYDRKTYIQGFLTDTNLFLDRYEALKLAKENGQIPKDWKYAELFSEDLWPPTEDDTI